jgi:hypothetical protein
MKHSGAQVPFGNVGRKAPAIMAAGMVRDRTDVIFAVPEEIDKMIKAPCWSPNHSVRRALFRPFLIKEVADGGINPARV